MKFPMRLDRAIQKLYEAFHNGFLIPECACQCAVGNVCDNKDSWKHFTNAHGSVELNYVGKVNELFGKKFNGYSPLELLKLEAEFLQGCGYSLPINAQGVRPTKPTAKETLFEGLCAAVTYLCKLDGVANVMDYSQLFDFKNERTYHPSETSASISG